jgi:hypothetical protein
MRRDWNLSGAFDAPGPVPVACRKPEVVLAKWSDLFLEGIAGGTGNGIRAMVSVLWSS